MIMALVNYWTFEHLLFGFGTSLLVLTLFKLKYKSYTIPMIIILLWEVLEFRQGSWGWIYQFGNNIIDVIVGFVGILLGNFAYIRLIMNNEEHN